MLRVTAAVALSAGLVLASAATAQTAESGFTAEVGAAEVFDMTGAEVGVGYTIAAGHFRLTPTIGGFIYQGENDRYSFDANVDRCRDGTNGQFARDELCNDGAVDAFGRIEATFIIRNFEIGGGYRFAESDSVPYGTVAVRLNNGVSVKANAGSDYIGLGLALRR